MILATQEIVPIRKIIVKIAKKKSDLHFKTFIRSFSSPDLALPDCYLFWDPYVNVIEKSKDLENGSEMLFGTKADLIC